jgi:hypothetical protein
MAEVTDNEYIEITVNPKLLQFEHKSADDEEDDGADKEGIYLCLVMGEKLNVRYGYPACRKVYHPFCFTAFHHRNALAHNVKVLLHIALDAAEDNVKLNKICKYITCIADAEFPFM